MRPKFIANRESSYRATGYRERRLWPASLRDLTTGSGTLPRIVASPRTWFVEVALAALVLLISIGVLWHAAHQMSYHPDEGDYMWSARYFSYLAVERSVRGEAWGDNLWTHTQPMLTRYIVGSWLMVRGHNLVELPPFAYDWSRSFEENLRAGQAPNRSLLIDSRIPSVVLSAAAIMLLYALARVLAGPVAGIASSLIVVANPQVREHLVRAIPEPPLTFFLLVTLLLAVVGARRGRHGELPVLWALGVGIALGLALQSKLTATFSFVSITAWVLAIVATTLWRCRSNLNAAWREVWVAGRGWALAIVIAVVTFVVTNPHLYPNPVLHTQHLFEERTATMDIQRLGSPQDVTGNLGERTSYVLGGSLMLQPWQQSDHAPVWRGLPVAALLAPVGLAVLASRTRRQWVSLRRLSTDGLVVITALAYTAGIALSIHVYWFRYLVPPNVLASLLAGVGLATLVRMALRRRS